MAWNTQKVNIENIELHTSDIDLNTDNIESDLVVQHELTTITNSILTNTPVNASGQNLVCTVANSDYSVEVVAGASYLTTAEDGRIYLGISDAIDTPAPANILWTVPAGVTMPITIPSGTALHYYSGTALVEGRISRIN